MCGICGVVRFDGERPDPELLRAQLIALRHRGPDDQGLWMRGPAALGQARLSILDVGPGGHQPLASEDDAIQLVCNGEFYGADVQREALRAAGHVFHGRSDSEIALHLYEDHGDGMLARLRGMFAFALYDEPRGRLLLARISGEPAGCVALRALPDGAAEMKRLYVRDDFRGMGIGRMLAECVIDEARALGYGVVKLDTLPGMREAQRMYAELGFVDTAAYNDNPVDGVRFLALELRAARAPIS